MGIQLDGKYFAGGEEDIGRTPPSNSCRYVLVVVERGVRDIRPAHIPVFRAIQKFKIIRENRIVKKKKVVSYQT